jgi:hypothetical protein
VIFGFVFGGRRLMVPRNEVARRFAGLWFTWAPALLVLSGCGPNVPANPSTQPVHGTVTYKGEPLARGYVVFSPAPGSQGVPAEGALREDGTYDARAFVGQMGTMPGEYIVWFSPSAQAARGEDFAEPLPIPQGYQSGETSDIKKTVSDGDNTIDIEIPDTGEETGAAEE